MKQKSIALIVLNTVTAVSLVFIGFIVVMRVLRIDYTKATEADCASAVLITVAIATIIAVLATLLSYSAVYLLKGILKKRQQILVAAFLMFFICGVDAIYHGHFSRMPFSSRATIIYLNILAVMEMICTVVTAAVWER